MIHGTRANALAVRQRALLLRSAQLRAQFAADVQLLAPPLRLVDQVQAGWRWLRAHPAVPVALLVSLAVLRPRRALRWGLRLWWGWQTVQRFQRRLQALR
ncbi:YqjK family protein [Ideonella sp. A 288]|uniref:YqjK family protein n=1 Tax=Ideonella sp. A 288 TaxID=1962181 RepID=UPI00130341CD|nr:YqjK family protein [Ideonella sp. A 288]